MDKTTNTLASKLAQIQKELEAPKNQYNKFGNYYYRSSEDILEGLKKCKSFEGLSIIISDKVVKIGNRYYVKATAKITDGINTLSNTAYAREALEKKGMDSSQITGSTSSYARKYALNGLFAIDDTKDADSMNNDKKTNTKTEKLASDAQKKMIFALAKDLNLEAQETKKAIKKKYSLESFNNLTSFQASDAINSMQDKILRGERHG